MMTTMTTAPVRFADPVELDAQLYHVAFRAMGCEMGAWVLARDSAAAEERLNLVQMWMTLVDARLSRFKPDSELGRLNVSPGRQVAVSALLWDALAWALQAAQETGGLYNPTVLDALVAAGYERDFDEIRRGDGAFRAEPVLAAGRADALSPWSMRQQPGERQEPGERQQTGGHWRTIERDAMHRMVMLPPGLRLDLGGTAKGWAAARAAEMLESLGPCLVDAGGDLAVRGGLPGVRGWPIGIADPNNDAVPLATIVVRNRGVATSGVDYRRWVSGGAVQHHIIDPRTGQPASTDLLTATVIAPDVARADLYALVVMILGRSAGLALLESRPDLEGLLVDQGGRQWRTSGMGIYLPSTTHDDRAWR